MNSLPRRWVAGGIPRTSLASTRGRYSGATYTSSARRVNSNSRSSDKRLDIDALLSSPTWSVNTLLPPKDSSQVQEVTATQLRHLLRLSALPPPKDAEEEQKMLATLSSQLHFVKEIQKVDTTGIEPLRSLRDETAAGEGETEIGMDALKDALALEEVKGKFHPRVRRRNAEGGKKGVEWDVLDTAERKVGRYFVVEGGKDR